MKKTFGWIIILLFGGFLLYPTVVEYGLWGAIVCVICLSAAIWLLNKAIGWVTD